MKKGIIISAVILSSCTKSYNCCTESTTSGLVGDAAFANGTTNHCIDWTGNNDDKNQREADGTQTTVQTWYDVDTTYDYTIEQKTTCTPD